MTQVRSFITAILLTSLWSGIASADFQRYNPYPDWSYYNSYSRSRSSGPIYSLELDPQKSLNESMRVAAREERLEDVEEMIAKGADVNGSSSDGQTALIYASRNCSVDVVRVLLKHHARVNLKDSYGRTALTYAVMESCLPVTELLLKQRAAKATFVDDERFSILDYAEKAAELDVDGPALQILKLIRQAVAHH